VPSRFVLFLKPLSSRLPRKTSHFYPENHVHPGAEAGAAPVKLISLPPRFVAKFSLQPSAFSLWFKIRAIRG
jgi:hypothetical protein